MPEPTTRGHGNILDNLSDSALARYQTACRRAIEDGDADAAQYAQWAARARQLQLSRFRLRLRYGARCRYGPPGDRGTNSYDRYMRFDEPPAYELAAAIDRTRCAAGRSHVLAWVVSSPAATASEAPLSAASAAANGQRQVLGPQGGGGTVDNPEHTPREAP